MKKSAAIPRCLPGFLFLAGMFWLSIAAAQDAGICPSSSMPGELEIPQDMLFDVKELDDDPTDGRIAPESCANITMLKASSSFEWESSDPDNFRLDKDLTEKKGAANRVCLSKDACGSATITVIDADGHQYILSVLSFMGRWGEWTEWITTDDPCAGEYYASSNIDVCGDKSRQYEAAFFGAQHRHDECPTSWAICSQNCCVAFHAFAGFPRISAAWIRERQWICSSPKTID